MGELEVSREVTVTGRFDGYATSGKMTLDDLDYFIKTAKANGFRSDAGVKWSIGSAYEHLTLKVVRDDS